MTPLDKEVAEWMEGFGAEKRLTTSTDGYEWFMPNTGAIIYPRTAAFFYTAQTNKTAKLTADLAWCLGKLRGLGHPAEHLEAQLNQTKLEKQQ